MSIQRASFAPPAGYADDDSVKSDAFNGMTSLTGRKVAPARGNSDAQG